LGGHQPPPTPTTPQKRLGVTSVEWTISTSVGSTQRLERRKQLGGWAADQGEKWGKEQERILGKIWGRKGSRTGTLANERDWEKWKKKEIHNFCRYPGAEKAGGGQTSSMK